MSFVNNRIGDIHLLNIKYMVRITVYLMASYGELKFFVE